MTDSPRRIRSKIGSLEVTSVLADEGSSSLAVILCHGFGAPGDDLVSIGEELLRRRPRLSGKVRFVFPEAPLSLSQMGMYGARAWWMLDPERLVALQMGDGTALERMKAEIPAGLAEARQALTRVVNEVLAATGLPMSKVVLGGFSQGAMITTDLTLRLEEPPAALVIMSGTLICAPEWKKRAPIRRGLCVLQSHGTEDPLLGFETAEELRDLLTASGLNVDFVPFEGGHTITLEVLERFGALLESLV